jgi:hypothetical protein
MPTARPGNRIARHNQLLRLAKNGLYMVLIIKSGFQIMKFIQFVNNSAPTKPPLATTAAAVVKINANFKRQGAIYEEERF